MSFKVRKKRCETCIFSNRSPVSDDRFLELEAAWKEDGVHQECHQATIKGVHVACRGHYDAAAQGAYPAYPALREMKNSFYGLESMRPEQTLWLAERMGLIEFTHEDEV